MASRITTSGPDSTLRHPPAHSQSQSPHRLRLPPEWRPAHRIACFLTRLAGGRFSSGSAFGYGFLELLRQEFADKSACKEGSESGSVGNWPELPAYAAAVTLGAWAEWRLRN
jgi:hypothetical protein